LALVELPEAGNNCGMSESPKDKFEELFRMQQALMNGSGSAPSHERGGQTKWLLNYTRAMSQENGRTDRQRAVKWWAKYQKFDGQNARVEVVDHVPFR